jgi:hypothetical protein
MRRFFEPATGLSYSSKETGLHGGSVVSIALLVEGV